VLLEAPELGVQHVQGQLHGVKEVFGICQSPNAAAVDSPTANIYRLFNAAVNVSVMGPQRASSVLL
jgi:hypothetical protein